MKVLILHNRYRQPGGEDLVVESEVRLLRKRGIETLLVELDNDGAVANPWRAGWNSPWSKESYRYVKELCRELAPDVVHVHNFWMGLTPAAHRAAREAGAATVQTLHNYRLVCLGATLLREGVACEDCVGKLPWRGVVRRCYRGSTAASAAVARMIINNRRRGTWEREVDAFIALSEHSREKLVAGGLPEERIHLKRNFVEDPGSAAVRPSESRMVLYAGRLAAEKNLGTLVRAWRQAGLGQLGRLVIVGDGPERLQLEAQAGGEAKFLGRREPAEVQRLMQNARLVVQPSLSESCPRMVLEALAHGRPVVGSASGPVAELVQHGVSGLRCDVTDARALGAALALLMQNGEMADRLGTGARRQYLEHFTPERNFEELMEVYRWALERRTSWESGSARLAMTRYAGFAVGG